MVYHRFGSFTLVGISSVMHGKTYRWWRPEAYN